MRVSALKKSINLSSALAIEIIADIHALLLLIVTPYDSARAMNIVSELLERDPLELLYYIADPRLIMVAVLATINNLKEFETRRKMLANQQKINSAPAPPAGSGERGGGHTDVEQTA